MKGEKKRENTREKSQPGVWSRVGFCAMLFFVFARAVFRT